MQHKKYLTSLQPAVIICLLGYIFYDHSVANSIHQTETETSPIVDLDVPNTSLLPKSIDIVSGSNMNDRNTKHSQHQMTVIDDSQEALDKVVQGDENKYSENKQFLFNQLLEQTDESLENFMSANEDSLYFQIENDPDFVSVLLDGYSVVKNAKIERVLSDLIAYADAEGTEEHAMLQLDGAAETEKDKWLNIMSKVGTTTSDSRSSILNHLNQADNPRSIVLAINSLAPIGADATERNAVVVELNQYLHNDNEYVRASAIESLSYWSRKNDSSYIVNGLHDDSKIVRSAAIEAAGQTALISNEIKYSLFEILLNEALPIEERVATANALQLQDLTDQEYDSLSLFGKLHLN